MATIHLRVEFKPVQKPDFKKSLPHLVSKLASTSVVYLHIQMSGTSTPSHCRLSAGFPWQHLLRWLMLSPLQSLHGIGNQLYGNRNKKLIMVQLASKDSLQIFVCQ